MRKIYNCRLCNSEDVVTRNFPEKTWIDSLSDLHISSVSMCFCNQCNFLFKETEIAYDKFYENDYIIPFANSDDDNIYDVINNDVLYRTDKQTLMIKDFLDPEKVETKILDFGCAKAQTAAKLARTTAISMSAYDITANYKDLWESYNQPIDFSVANIPAEWSSNFDIVYSFFAFEHISELHNVMKIICEVLKADGIFLLLVPNPLSNFVDIQVLDHINHFSPKALRGMFEKYGLSVVDISLTTYKGGLFISGRKNSELAENKWIEPGYGSVISALEFWDRYDLAMLDNKVDGKKILIHGAGINCLWILNSLNGAPDLITVVDNNPSLHNTEFHGYKVQRLADVHLENYEVIFLAVRPDIQNLLMSGDYKNHKEKVVISPLE